MLFLPLSLPIDEADAALRLIPLPEVAQGREYGEWHIFTARKDPAFVRSRIDAWAAHRKGWTRSGGAWSYGLQDPDNPQRVLFVGVRVFRGRAVRREAAVSPRDLWATVLVTVQRSSFLSGPAPHAEWVIANRPQDDAALNAPRGEERDLPRLVGLPLAAHRTDFGSPWWQFTGPGRREDVEARVAARLRDRPGWTPQPWSNLDGDRRVGGTNWSFASAGERSLHLSFESGRALVKPPARPVEGSWTTVVVFVEEPSLAVGPVSPWPVYRASITRGAKRPPSRSGQP